MRKTSITLACAALVVGAFCLPAPVFGQTNPQYSYADLHNFGSYTDGKNPYSSLTLHGGGLFGTTAKGGNQGVGTVWSFTASGTYADLLDIAEPYEFPKGGVTFDTSGNMWGATDAGPGGTVTIGTGSVWELTTSSAVHYSTWSSAIEESDAGVTIGPNGYKYGTSVFGGPNRYNAYLGTVWAIKSTNAFQQPEIIHAFGALDDNGNPWDGINPNADVTFDSQGNMYGTCTDGGTNYIGMGALGPVHGGIVWEITASGEYKILHDFGGTVTNANGNSGRDGYAPYGGVTLDSAGNLYGTTFSGGPINVGNDGCGMVWEITASGVYKDLHDFGGTVVNANGKTGTDGINPRCSVKFDALGNMYGTTELGGPNASYVQGYALQGGIVWQLRPGINGYVDLHDFGGSTTFSDGSSGDDGYSPYAGVTLTNTGQIYGTTDLGGRFGYGMLWVLSAPYTGAISSLTVSPTAVNEGSSATGTITPAGIASVTVNPNSILGGNSSTGTVTLTGSAAPGGVTVTLSSSSAFATVPASVTMPSGQSSTTFNVGTSPVSAETAVTISATLNGQTRAANLTIEPAGVQALRLNPSFVQGGNSSSGTVTLTGPSGPSGTLVSLSNTTGFTKIPPTLVVPMGQTTATFTIGTSPVGSLTRDTLTAVANHGSVSTVLVITPATLTGLSINPSSIVGGNNATGTVTLSGPAGPNEVVSLTSSNPAATVSTVTVPVGQTSGSFTITTHGVGVTVLSTITGTLGAQTQSASLTINPAQLVGLDIAPSQVLGGVSSMGTLLLNGQAGPSGIAVSLSSNSTLATVPKTVTIPSGLSQTTFAIPTLPVSSDETATVTAKSGSFSTHASLMIVPAAVVSVSFDPSSVPGGVPSTGTVTLSGPAGASGIVISLKSNSVSAKPEDTQFVIAKGQTSGTFKVNTVGGAVSTTATITATAMVNSSWSAARLTIGPVGIQSVTFNPTSVVGVSNSNVTVKLTGPAPAGGLTVNLSSNSNAAILTGPSLKIGGGLTSAEAPIKTLAVAVNTTATITATLGTGSLSGSFQILAPKLVSLTLDPSSVTGGSASRGTVSISSAAPVGGLTISLSSDSSRALPGTNVVIPAGKTSASFQIITTSSFSRVTANIKAILNGASVSAALTIHS